MDLEFVKMHGLGNDFVFIDNFSHDIQLTPEQVVHLCDRHFGIGGDGVVLVEPSTKPECVAYMHYINADGSIAEMCGNAIRCFAKYLIDHGSVSSHEKTMSVETRAGIRHLTFETDENGVFEQATVDMGEPILEPERIPTTLAANAITECKKAYVDQVELSSPWGNFAFTCVSMGNPHAVCFIDTFEALNDECFFDAEQKVLATLRVDILGAYFESHTAFPQKANIEFAHVGVDGIDMRVFERACGETLACGTGACAVGVAAVLTKRAGGTNDIHLPGGTLQIKWDENNHVFMTGIAQTSFVGTVHL